MFTLRRKYFSEGRRNGSYRSLKQGMEFYSNTPNVFPELLPDVSQINKINYINPDKYTEQWKN